MSCLAHGKLELAASIAIFEVRAETRPTVYANLPLRNPPHIGGMEEGQGVPIHSDLIVFPCQTQKSAIARLPSSPTLLPTSGEGSVILLYVWLEVLVLLAHGGRRWRGTSRMRVA